MQWGRAALEALEHDERVVDPSTTVWDAWKKELEAHHVRFFFVGYVMNLVYVIQELWGNKYFGIPTEGDRNAIEEARTALARGENRRREALAAGEPAIAHAPPGIVRRADTVDGSLFDVDDMDDSPVLMDRLTKRTDTSRAGSCEASVPAQVPDTTVVKDGVAMRDWAPYEKHRQNAQFADGASLKWLMKKGVFTFPKVEGQRVVKQLYPVPEHCEVVILVS